MQQPSKDEFQQAIKHHSQLHQYDRLNLLTHTLKVNSLQSFVMTNPPTHSLDVHIVKCLFTLIATPKPLLQWFSRASEFYSLSIINCILLSFEIGYAVFLL